MKTIKKNKKSNLHSGKDAHLRDTINDLFSRSASVNCDDMGLIVDCFIHLDYTPGVQLKQRGFAINLILENLDRLAKSEATLSSAISFIDVLFEAIQDKYIEAGYLDKDTRAFKIIDDEVSAIPPAKAIKAIMSGTSIGIIGNHMTEDIRHYPKAFVDAVYDCMQLVAYYDGGIEIASDVSSVADFSGSISREMKEVMARTDSKK